MTDKIDFKKKLEEVEEIVENMEATKFTVAQARIKYKKSLELLNKIEETLNKRKFIIKRLQA